MKTLFKHLISLLCNVTFLTLIFTQSALAAATDGFYSQVPPNLNSMSNGTLITSELETNFLTPFNNVSSAYRILYRSTGQLGNPVTVGGMVFIPKGNPPAGGWPIVAWDHGTSGVGDQCNPSRWPDLYDNGQWRVYLNQIDNLLSQGYLVVATDYEGLGTPGLHTYLLSDALGRATIDGVRAAKHLIPNTDTKWAAIGHSEGGQASIAAGEFAATSYGAGLTFLGAVAYAPSSNTRLLMDSGPVNKFSSPYLAYFAVGMKSINSNFNYSSFVGSLYSDRMQLAEEHCFDEWFIHDNYGLNPTNDTAYSPNWSNDPTVISYLAQTNVGKRPSAGPVLVLQGTGDGLISVYPYLISDLCAHGTVTSGITYKNVSHDHVVVVGWNDAKNWLADRFAGNQITDNLCTQ